MPRRTFLGTLTALTAGAPTLLRATGAKARLPISFSTLGCPRWPWKQILAEADRLGYAAVELRGLMGEMDLTRRFEFQPGQLAATRADLAALGLRVASVDSSARMHESGAAERAAQLDEGRRFIDLAAALGAPYVRVFGDKVPAGEAREVALARIVEGFRELAGHARQAGVTLLMETHGDFTNSPAVVELMRGIDRPEVLLLWDAHHTVATGGEQPAATFAQIGPWVRHTHLKDSRPDGGGRRYVLTGQGDIPLREIVRTLVTGGYRGYYSFEWEKAWHPEIEEPELAIPHFASAISDYLAAAGV